VPGARVTLALSTSSEAALRGDGRGDVLAALPAGDCGALSVRGSRGTDLRVRLGGLRLG